MNNHCRNKPTLSSFQTCMTFIFHKIQKKISNRRLWDWKKEWVTIYNDLHISLTKVIRWSFVWERQTGLEQDDRIFNNTIYNSIHNALQSIIQYRMLPICARNVFPSNTPPPRPVAVCDSMTAYVQLSQPISMLIA